MTDQQSTRVVVIGGGYAGTLAANRLATRADLDVVLVNPRPTFVERIRLHQLVAGTGAATQAYRTVLAAGVRLVVDSAVHIDTGGRSVGLASGDALDYDHVVYAVGSTGDVSAVPGADRFAFPIAELERARLLRDAVEAAHPDAPITVVGAGLTGIETAAELAERGRTVRLLCGGALAPSLSEAGRRSVARRLEALRVDVREAATVTEVRPDAVLLDDGSALSSAVTVWAAGFGVPDLATRSGLSADALGRLRTDETLTSVDDDRVVATGDAAAPPGRTIRMSCQAAVQLGVQAADTVLSRVAGTAASPVAVRFTGSCLSVGRRAGTIQFARTDDSPVPVVVGGRAAASIKEAVCRSTVWALRREARASGRTARITGGRPASVPRPVGSP